MSATSVVATKHSQARLNKAVNDRFYYKIADGDNHVRISGAVTAWKNNPNLIYLPSARVVGTEAELRAYLTNSGYDASAIQNVLNQGFSAASANDARFLAEVAEYKAWKKLADAAKAAKDANKTTYSWAQYAQIRDGIRSGAIKAEDKKETASTGAAKTGKGKGKGRVGKLYEKLLAARSSGQSVYDVSKITKEGAGVQKRGEAPGPTSKKRAATGLREIISSDRNAFATAMALLNAQKPASDTTDYMQFVAAWDSSVAPATLGGGLVSAAPMGGSVLPSLS